MSAKRARLIGKYVKFSLAIFCVAVWSAASAGPVKKTHVLFFGGYGSTKAQMIAWSAAANAIAEKQNLAFDFSALPINSAYPDAAHVINDNADVIRTWSHKITVETAEDFLVVGHSSGSAISNAIVSAVKNREVPLISLDGYLPDANHQVNSECWSSVDARDPSKHSLNTLAERSCRNYREIKITGCETAMCLHFALVNVAAPKVGLTSANYKSLGYSQLIPFLGWL